MARPDPSVPSRRIALMLETDGPGGAEVMLLQLADALRERGHRVLAVGPRDQEGWLSGEFIKRGFDLAQFAIRHPLDLPGYLGLRRLLSEHRVEIVHSHEFTMAVYGGMAARSLRLPHVITMHGDSWSMKAWRRRAALRWAFRRSREVVAVSRATHGNVTGMLGLRPEAVRTIPNGIKFVPGDRAPLRRELGLADAAVLVVAVGNLIERKGHIVLLRAMAALRGAAAQVDWHVAIAGSGDQGDEEAKLRAFIAAQGMGDRVHLLGHRQDISNILAASDIYTMPSLWEGLPVALLEAMFARRPVVASGVSGIPEAVVHERDGLLTAPGDHDSVARALEILLPDADARERYAAAALARATAEFGIDAMTDAYERSYGIRA